MYFMDCLERNQEFCHSEIIICLILTEGLVNANIVFLFTFCATP